MIMDTLAALALATEEPVRFADLGAHGYLRTDVCMAVSSSYPIWIPPATMLCSWTCFLFEDCLLS
jgi:hypothetical protein